MVRGIPVSSAILQLCQLIAVSAGRHMAWATMIQRAIWLSHTAVPERERASLIQGPLVPDGLYGPRSPKCSRTNSWSVRTVPGSVRFSQVPPSSRPEGSGVVPRPNIPEVNRRRHRRDQPSGASGNAASWLPLFLSL